MNNPGLHHWLPPREIESRVESLLKPNRLRDFIILILGFVLGYFVFGLWPIHGWVLEILRRLYA